MPVTPNEAIRWGEAVETLTRGSCKFIKNATEAIKGVATDTHAWLHSVHRIRGLNPDARTPVIRRLRKQK